MPDPQHTVETLRDKLQNGARGGSDRDREVLLEFSNTMELMRETYGWYRHEKMLRHCVRISEEVDGVELADALENRDAAETIVRWIHRTYDMDETPETNQSYRVALRVFGRRTTEDGVDGPDTPPASIDWVSSTLPNDYDPSPDPADMLEWEDDIEPMIEAARNPRDAAAITLQFDAGLRGGELYDLCVSDITDTDHGLAVSVDGKQGQRSVDLIPSTPYVNDWLAKHPGGPGDYLWTRISSPDRLSYKMYLRMFKEPAKRAGVEKDVTPTNLRKSNLAWLARQGMNARYIEQRQGRKHGSDAVARYAAIFDEDVGDEYARLMGLDVEEDTDQDLAPVTCPRCDKETPRDEDRCVWCGQAIRPDAAETDQSDRIELANLLASAEGQTADDLAQIMEILENNPRLREAITD